MKTDLRLAVLMWGDIQKKQGVKIKHEIIIHALSQYCQAVDVFDASLQGAARIFNAARVFSPNLQTWKQRFYQNVPAFQGASQRASSFLKDHRDEYDVALQISTLFDAQWQPVPIPSVIYTDYTAYLSGLKPGLGRSPFTQSQRQQWINLEKKAYQKANHICTRGTHVRQSIIDHYQISPEKVTAIGGGINFKTLPENSSLKKNNEKQTTILFIGNDFYRKGGDLLLTAFQKIRITYPSSRLVMVTKEKDFGEYNLTNVEVIQTAYDRGLIQRLYQEADIFVLPSRLETWGDVLLEAMAYALPCIGVQGESMEDIIQQNATGLIVPQEDPQALTNAILQLLENPDWRKQLGNNGRQRVESFFTWPQVIKRILPILQTAAQQQ